MIPNPMREPITLPVRVLEGFLLYAVALAVGARVTGWVRTRERNAEVGGHPESYHLWGGAVDVAADTTAAQRQVLSRLAKEVDETDRQDAPHYHYQVDGRALPVLVAVIAAAGLSWNQWTKGGRR